MERLGRLVRFVVPLERKTFFVKRLAKMPKKIWPRRSSANGWQE